MTSERRLLPPEGKSRIIGADHMDCRAPGSLGSGGALQYNSGFDDEEPCMRLVILLALTACLGGCTGLLVSDSRSRAPAMEQDEGTGRSPRDNAIEAELRQNLDRDAELKNYTIGVRIQDGKVTLSGAVGSYPARDRAVAIARRTNGVRSVDNRIVVNTNL
jgi:hypothetical protein